MDIGLCGRAETLVSSINTATAMKSGALEVFATPSVVALIEQACYESVAEYLDKEMGSVGVLINIKHIAATACGKKVWAKSKLISAEGRHLVFEVAAFDEDKKIAEGTHERVIINCEKFMEKLK